MSHLLLRHAIAVFVFVVVAGLVGIIAHRPSRRASRLGLRGMKRRRAIEESAVWAQLEPLVRWLGVQTSRFVSDDLRQTMDRRLTHAGDVLGLTADEYAALAVVGGGVGVGLGCALFAAVPSLGVASLAIGTTLGAFLPSLLVGQTMKARQLRIRRGLPYVLDVLCLALGAGSDFTGAVSQVVEKARSNREVREELGYFLQQLTVGQSRISALRELAERVPIAPVRELALAVQQAEERGSSIVATLEIQAASSRIARTNEAQKAAEGATSKLVVPTMGFSMIALYFLFATFSWFEQHIMSGISGGGT